MFKQLFAILFLIFSSTIANAFEDKPLILDKSYVKLGYGLVHLPEIIMSHKVMGMELLITLFQMQNMILNMMQVLLFP